MHQCQTCSKTSLIFGFLRVIVFNYFAEHVQKSFHNIKDGDGEAQKDAFCFPAAKLWKMREVSPVWFGHADRKVSQDATSTNTEECDEVLPCFSAIAGVPAI